MREADLTRSPRGEALRGSAKMRGNRSGSCNNAADATGTRIRCNDDLITDGTRRHRSVEQDAKPARTQESAATSGRLSSLSLRSKGNRVQLKVMSPPESFSFSDSFSFSFLFILYLYLSPRPFLTKEKEKE
jgi:hypothetical protein